VLHLLIEKLQLRVCPEITSEFLSPPTGQILSIVGMERIVNSEVKKGQCLSLLYLKMQHSR
jgi:hypothetical protein